MLRAVLNLHHEIWLFHNDAVHNDPVCEQELHDAAIQAVTAEHSLGMDDLSKGNRNLMTEVPLQVMLDTYDRSKLELWLRQVRTARKHGAQLRHRRSRHPMAAERAGMARWLNRPNPDTH